jgi:hypothetical protein
MSAGCTLLGITVVSGCIKMYVKRWLQDKACRGFLDVATRQGWNEYYVLSFVTSLLHVQKAGINAATVRSSDTRAVCGTPS